MRVLLLSRYDRLGASSRLRSFQYLPYLEQAGFEVTIAPLFDDDYVRGLSSGIISWYSILKAYWTRLRFILKAKQFDLVWLEYEMLPWLPSWIELTLFPKNIPMVVDYDDAIFHRYDQHHSRLVRKLLGQKIDAVMRRAAVVIVGNDYLGDRAKQAGAKRVVVLPTVVDVNRYATVETANTQAVTIGWIGQPSTAKYLTQLVPELNGILLKHGAHIVAIGPKASQFQFLPVDVKPWAEDTEVAEIQQFDIGIMPLTDSFWERGKCGYKLIQYMACGKPVVATPIGINNIIVRQGENGFLADSQAEWCEALDRLCADATLRKQMGAKGRKMIEQKYALNIVAPRLVALLRSVVNS